MVKALDIQPSVRIYQLIASISVQKGDYARAEVTLRTGLESFGDDPDLHYDLACVYRNTKRFEQAQAQVVQLKQYETSERVDALEQALLQDTGATAQPASEQEAEQKPKKTATAKKTSRASKSAADAEEPVISTETKKRAGTKSAASEEGADAAEPITSAKAKKAASAKSAAETKAPPRAKSAVSKKRAAATEPAAEEKADTKTEKAAVKKSRTKKTTGNL